MQLQQSMKAPHRIFKNSKIGNSIHIELRCMFDNKEGCVRAECFRKAKSEHLTLYMELIRTDNDKGCKWGINCSGMSRASMLD